MFDSDSSGKKMVSSIVNFTQKLISLHPFYQSSKFFIRNIQLLA